MKVILLQDVAKIGKKYDMKKLKDGYVLNFLFPKKLAILATTEAITEIERRQREILIEREVQDDLLDKNLEDIKGKTITISAKADEKGHLFSAIHEKMLAETLDKECHVQISEKFIVPEEPIKKIGEFKIPVLVKNKKSSFKLVVEKI